MERYTRANLIANAPAKVVEAWAGTQGIAPSGGTRYAEGQPTLETGMTIVSKKKAYDLRPIVAQFRNTELMEKIAATDKRLRVAEGLVESQYLSVEGYRILNKKHGHNIQFIKKVFLNCNPSLTVSDWKATGIARWEHRLNNNSADYIVGPDDISRDWRHTVFKRTAEVDGLNSAIEQCLELGWTYIVESNIRNAAAECSREEVLDAYRTFFEKNPLQDERNGYRMDPPSPRGSQFKKGDQFYVDLIHLLAEYDQSVDADLIESLPEGYQGPIPSNWRYGPVEFLRTWTEWVRPLSMEDMETIGGEDFLDTMVSSSRNFRNRSPAPEFMAEDEVLRKYSSPLLTTKDHADVARAYLETEDGSESAAVVFNEALQILRIDHINARDYAADKNPNVVPMLDMLGDVIRRLRDPLAVHIAFQYFDDRYPAIMDDWVESSESFREALKESYISLVHSGRPLAGAGRTGSLSEELHDNFYETLMNDESVSDDVFCILLATVATRWNSSSALTPVIAKRPRLVWRRMDDLNNLVTGNGFFHRGMNHVQDHLMWYARAEYNAGRPELVQHILNTLRAAMSDEEAARQVNINQVPGISAILETEDVILSGLVPMKSMLHDSDLCAVISRIFTREFGDDVDKWQFATEIMYDWEESLQELIEMVDMAV